MTYTGTSISPKITVGALELAINYNNIKHACELVEGKKTILLYYLYTYVFCLYIFLCLETPYIISSFLLELLSFLIISN